MAQTEQEFFSSFRDIALFLGECLIAELVYIFLPVLHLGYFCSFQSLDSNADFQR